MPVNELQMECSRCKVATTCPRNGSSPLLLPTSNRKKVFCSIVGGYGRTPVAEHILGAESLTRMKKDGPCMTIAKVPTLDPGTKTVYMETVKIFSQPVKHPRETVPFNINLMYPENPNVPKPRGKR